MKSVDVFPGAGNNSGLPSNSSSGSPTWMAGFFLLGTLLGMLGSLVITWHYHIEVEPRSIGSHFLGMSAGFVAASVAIPRLFSRFSLRTIAMASSVLSFASMVGLALLAPPAAASWRIAMLTITGIAAGGLTYSLFHANHARFSSSPATAANHAGALFVGGGLLATIVVGVTYFGISIRIQTALLSLIPAFYLIILLRNRFPAALQPAQPYSEDLMRDTLKDLRSIATLLFSLLIFFQFACEWAIVGWLPLFLVHTLGINPVTAIWALGLYFLALMVGRLLSQLLLPIVNHKKMLLFSVALAMFGYLLLTITGFTLFAIVAAVLTGIGHAPIYPLVAERLDDRLSYQPGFYSGTISIAMAGAMTTPWLLGYVAQSYGMPAVMLVPALASAAVLVLSILIMLESRLMGGKHDDAPNVLLASDH